MKPPLYIAALYYCKTGGKRVVGKCFTHLSWSDRIKIDVLRRNGYTLKRISEEIGCAESTVCRELKRGVYEHTNSDLTTEMRYSPEMAHEKYKRTIKERGQGSLKIGNNLKLLLYLEEKIAKEHMSPYAALESAKKEKSIMGDTKLCLSTVYNYIRHGVFPNITLQSCPMPARKNRKKKVLTIKKATRGTSIEKRPEYINDCSEEGHWEMDTVEGCKGSKESILVLTERKTMLEVLEPMRHHTMEEVVRALDRIERRIGEKAFRNTFKTITVDNGCEFSDWIGIERSKRNKTKRTKVYVCHPYCSWERGRNESQNKFIRRFFPKGTNFDGTPRTTIKLIQDYINNYPRLKHNGRSALEVTKLCI